MARKSGSSRRPESGFELACKYLSGATRITASNSQKLDGKVGSITRRVLSTKANDGNDGETAD